MQKPCLCKIFHPPFSKNKKKNMGRQWKENKQLFSHPIVYFDSIAFVCLKFARFRLILQKRRKIQKPSKQEINIEQNSNPPAAYVVMHHKYIQFCSKVELEYVNPSRNNNKSAERNTLNKYLIFLASAYDKSKQKFHLYSGISDLKPFKDSWFWLKSLTVVCKYYFANMMNGKKNPWRDGITY